MLVKQFAPILNYEALKVADFYFPNIAYRGELYVSYDPRENKIIFVRNCYFPQKLEIPCIYLQNTFALDDKFCAVGGYEAFNLNSGLIANTQIS